MRLHQFTVVICNLFRTIICSLIGYGALALQSCQQEPDNPTTQPVTYDIVRYDGASAFNNTLSFSLFPTDGSERLLLAAPAGSRLPSIQPGQFALLGYVCANDAAPAPDRPTPIEIIGCSKISTFSVKKAQPATIVGWDADPIELIAAWQAGEAMLMRAKLPESEKKRTMALLFDETALTGEIIDAYFYHRRPDIKPSAPSTYYMAYDLTPVWEQTEATAIRVHFSVADNLMMPNPQVSEKTVMFFRP